MGLRDAGKTDLEKRESSSTSDNRNDVDGFIPIPAQGAPEFQDTTNEKQGNGLTRSTSLPELKAVASNALSRTISKITNRDVVDPGPAPGMGIPAQLSPDS
jgi:hypothetical protein